MFAEIRRKDRMSTPEQAEELLTRGEHGMLSTVGADGYPYGIPVNYAYENGRIYFHCARGVGKKLENIQRNPKVCFTVVGTAQVVPAEFSTNYESTVVFGTAQEITELDEKKAALELLIRKYSPEFLETGRQYIERSAAVTGVYVISVQHISGKARRGKPKMQQG